MKQPYITLKKIETVITSAPTQLKSPGTDGFSIETYQTFKEVLTPILLKLFHKMKTKGTLPNSSYEVAVLLYINHTKMEKQR